ncbi:hypothetical protein C2845_PM02G21860 [Panicum miliaceum]|uniref:TFIIS N-terminal domain-containing protein n=1 Tax=Panicum miliaceum TaxID=4540 RepID=A0A3L6SD74_PANMI|nr:hypothetical protein C2845_PM02G21860 [Panicum miliaceum]
MMIPSTAGGESIQPTANQAESHPALRLSSQGWAKTPNTKKASSVAGRSHAAATRDPVLLSALHAAISSDAPKHAMRSCSASHLLPRQAEPNCQVNKDGKLSDSNPICGLLEEASKSAGREPAPVSDSSTAANPFCGHVAIPPHATPHSASSARQCNPIGMLSRNGGARRSASDWNTAATYKPPSRIPDLTTSIRPQFADLALTLPLTPPPRSRSRIRRLADLALAYAAAAAAAIAGQSPLRRWKPFFAAFGLVDAAIEGAGPALCRDELRSARGDVVELLCGVPGGGGAEELCVMLDGFMAESLVTLQAVPAEAVPRMLASSADLARAVGSLRCHQSARISGLAREIIRGWSAAVHEDIARTSAAMKKLDDLCRVKASDASPPLPSMTKPIAGSHDLRTEKTEAATTIPKSLTKTTPPSEEKMEATKRKLREGYRQAPAEDPCDRGAQDAGAEAAEDAPDPSRAEPGEMRELHGCEALSGLIVREGLSSVGDRIKCLCVIRDV